jgi:hypothetical protein
LGRGVRDGASARATVRLLEPQNRCRYFDDIHPTSAGHRVVMRSILRVLDHVVPGDVNGDHVVNLSDFDALDKV